MSALPGRRKECAALDRLLAAVGNGAGRTLVVRGEPGIGKTALLQYLAGRASGCRVARAAGVESEMELAYAALHQLCAPMLEESGRLPEPQRAALETAFGLSAGEPPDRFLVGLAVLGLMAEVAAERPLVCIVDDAQWLDASSAQALAFAARRLVADPVALLFGVREPARSLQGLPELLVEGLPAGDAAALLSSAVRGPLDETVRDRIVAETRGNPLALLELPRDLTPAELAGGFGVPQELGGRIEESFQHRLEELPDDSQTLLLVAAAEPLGEPVLLWRAAGRLGIAMTAAAPVEAAGLLEIGARVRFRHPLVRSAVYRAAPPEARRGAHDALAHATDVETDPDRHAWHRAHAAAGPDDAVAEELERSASRAQARGGLAAAAAFYERAARLTADLGARTRRALAAAQAKHQAGGAAEALDLLALAQTGPLDELRRAQVDLLRAQIAYAESRGRDAPALLLSAARRLEPADPVLARETYLDALSAAIFAGRLAARDGDVAEAARAAREAPSAGEPPRATDLALDGLALVVLDGYAAGAPVLKRALASFRRDDGDQALRWGWLACRTATDLWDDEAWEELATRFVRLARAAGALSRLPVALSALAGLKVRAGDFAAAGELDAEADEIAELIGIQSLPYLSILMAGWRGREIEALSLIGPATEAIVARGEGLALTIVQYAKAVLYNGLGRYEEALAAAERDPGERFSPWALVEAVEAAARSGEDSRAAGALERLTPTTEAAGTDWALGLLARSRALLTGDEALYREAIERLGRTRIRGELARAHLVYGEWLRRERRRLDAREELRIAHELLSAMGLGAFAIRAERELLATGERVRRRSAGAGGGLTAQEAQIARLAREGLSNPEIGAQLFISPRTVEYHLRKVYSKLGIGSRIQLDRALADL